MKLKVLGSGSKGNCYILENDAEALIIEAGVPFKEVKIALDFNVRKIVGVISTHCHLDHSKFTYEYEKIGIPSFKPYESEMEKQVRTYGKFVIKSFRLAHDVPCCGFYISHTDIGNIIYASDTEYIKYRFNSLNHILVECNYSKDYLEQDAVNRNHVLTGHMELETCKTFIHENLNPNLRNVCLLHLSDRNSDPNRFKREVEEVVGEGIRVEVAEKGLEISLQLKCRGGVYRNEQQEFSIKNSNITKIGFIKCDDCEENVICPHYEKREGCRTKEKIKEIELI